MKRLKKFFKYIINECKDLKTLVLFLCWWLICNSPIIVGYVLFFITKNKWHLTYANACLLFWTGPFTPEIPLCVGLAIGTRKIIEKIKGRKKKDAKEGISKQDN